MIFVYLLWLLYSLIAAPELFFKIFTYRDGPNFAFFYIVVVIIFGFSGIGGLYGIYSLLARGGK